MPSLKLVIPSIVMVTMLIVAASFIPTISAQTNPPIDDSELILRTEFYSASALQKTELIGRSTIDRSIRFLELDSTGTPLIDRAAFPDERSTYIAGEIQQQEIAALENLRGEIEVGENIETWVRNKSILLQTCESDAASALALGNWNSLTNGIQNAIITSLLQCQLINADITQKTIAGLLDLLVAEGIITLE